MEVFLPLAACVCLHLRRLQCISTFLATRVVILKRVYFLFARNTLVEVMFKKYACDFFCVLDKLNIDKLNIPGGGIRTCPRTP